MTTALGVARFVNVTLAGVLTGNEIGTWAAVHPALGTIPACSAIAAEQAVTRRYGQLMPGAMSATIVSAIPVLALSHDAPIASRLTLLGLGAFATMLAVTLVGNRPINQEVLRFSPEEPVETWRALRCRWDRLHRIRVLLDVVGLSCLVAAVVAPS
jgi:hypothetical protein